MTLNLRVDGIKLTITGPFGDKYGSLPFFAKRHTLCMAGLRQAKTSACRQVCDSHSGIIILTPFGSFGKSMAGG